MLIFVFNHPLLLKLQSRNSISSVSLGELREATEEVVRLVHKCQLAVDVDEDECNPNAKHIQIHPTQYLHRELVSHQRMNGRGIWIRSQVRKKKLYDTPVTTWGVHCIVTGRNLKCKSGRFWVLGDLVIGRNLCTFKSHTNCLTVFNMHLLFLLCLYGCLFYSLILSKQTC